MADVNEGNQNVGEPEEKDGKHPEVVSWTQYVGLKEKFNKTETKFKEQVSSLEEQLKSAIKPDEFSRTKKELDDIKAEHKKVSDELNTIKDKSVSEKRSILKEKGIPDDKLSSMSEKELDAVLGVVGSFKPKPDLGSGGGGGSLPNDPMSLFRMAKTKTK